MKEVVLFVTTGRTATHWLARTLSSLYSDLAIVIHEPISWHYMPNRFFRQYDRIEEQLNIPKIREHIEHVKCNTKEKTQIDVDWMVCSAIPVFVEVFGPRLKVIHLHRHPVFTALSLLTLNWYQPQFYAQQHTWRDVCTFEAFFPGTIHKRFADIWSDLTPYEKCLFHWAEINAYAFELQDKFPEVPFYRLKTEDMLDGSSGTLRSLLEFINLPYRLGIEDALSKVVDPLHHKAHIGFDWRYIYRHPEVVELAERLGYNLKDMRDEELARYKYRFHSLATRLYPFHRRYPWILNLTRAVGRKLRSFSKR
jgi:hypothetical protein